MNSLITLLIVTSLQSATAQEVHLKIKSLRCKPIVELNLNGKKAYFILDTGADISVLHSAVAERFGYQTVKNYARYTAVGLSNQQNDMLRVKNAQVTLEEGAVQAKFYATDMQHIVSAVRERTNFEIVGIIGSDIMRDYGFVIDYKTRTVKIYLDKKLG